MQRLTTGEAIAKSIIAQGTDVMFGIPGAHMYAFNDALARESNRLRFIVTRHEQGAGYMAYGYAKSSGKVGVYTVVPGPGVLNSASALCTAYGANTPMVCVTGNVFSHLIGRGRGQLHELPDQLATLRSFIKGAERIDHPTQAPRVVADAFQLARSGRPGPTAVEAAWDVMGESAPVALTDPPEDLPPPEPDPDRIAEAAKLIAEAKNPLIVVGGGAMQAGEAVLELACLLQAPVTTHRSGKGIVSDDNPLAMLSSAAWHYFETCDLVIGIGTRLELLHFRWQSRPKGLKAVRIDIDPVEMVRLRPDVGLIADAKSGTEALTAALAKLVTKRASRAEEFAGHRAKGAADMATIRPQIDYLNVIRDVLPRDGFFVEEVTQTGFVARMAFPVYEPRTYVTGGYQDNLGFGFHTALGVKVAHPDKPVVAATGDGGFLFGVQELATAVQHNINLVTVVFNNNAYGNVRRDQMESFDGRLMGSELVNPDFVKLAEAFGAVGLRVSTPEDLRSALERAFGESGPVIIEVEIERGVETSPWPFVLPGR